MIINDRIKKRKHAGQSQSQMAWINCLTRKSGQKARRQQLEGHGVRDDVKEGRLAAEKSELKDRDK